MLLAVHKSIDCEHFCLQRRTFLLFCFFYLFNFIPYFCGCYYFNESLFIYSKEINSDMFKWTTIWIAWATHPQDVCQPLWDWDWERERASAREREISLSPLSRSLSLSLRSLSRSLSLALSRARARSRSCFCACVWSIDQSLPVEAAGCCDRQQLHSISLSSSQSSA